MDQRDWSGGGGGVMDGEGLSREGTEGGLEGRG